MKHEFIEPIQINALKNRRPSNQQRSTASHTKFEEECNLPLHLLNYLILKSMVDVELIFLAHGIQMSYWKYY